MHRIKYLALVLLLVASLGAIGCDDNPGKGQKSEGNTRQSNYDRIVGQQPSHTMQYSPTRATINFWIDTWGRKPNKLAYVYLAASNGQLTGYYVFKGLPVSYCAAITPPEQLVGTPDDGSDAKDELVKAPSIDAVYYSGAMCNIYYGKDASTNSYMEFSVNEGQNLRIYERPLPRQNVEPLGFTRIK